MECKFCKKNFTTLRSYATHLSRTEDHNFSSPLEKEEFKVKSWYGEDLVNEIITKYRAGELCMFDITKMKIDLLKLFTLMGIKRTHSQEKKTERYKSKHRNTIMEIYGVDNISKSDAVKQKKKESATKKYGSYDNYVDFCVTNLANGFKKYKDSLTPEELVVLKQKREQTCAEGYGHPNFGLGEMAKAKSRKSRTETISQWDYTERLARTEIARAAVCSRGGYESKPEKRVKKALIDLDISFLGNVNLWKYNWDIVFNDVIIEVQGDMWHAWPEKYKATDLIMGKILASDIWEKDRKKLDIASKSGYKVIYIWEHEICKLNEKELIQFVYDKVKLCL